MCWINGQRTEVEDFAFEEGGTIFTDGSALGVGWDEVEECGAAAVQVGEEVRVARLRITGYPAAAVLAEHGGLLLACRFGGAGNGLPGDRAGVWTVEGRRPLLLLIQESLWRFLGADDRD